MFSRFVVCIPSRGSRPCRAGWGAFSLVELLVVIVIILVIFALIFPVASRIYLAGVGVKSANQLREIGNASFQYVADNNGCFFPKNVMQNGFVPPFGTPYGGGFQDWCDFLAPYLGPTNWPSTAGIHYSCAIKANKRKYVAHCPDGDYAFSEQVALKPDYSTNTFNGTIDWSRTKRLVSFSRPAEVVLCFPAEAQSSPNITGAWYVQLNGAGGYIDLGPATIQPRVSDHGMGKIPLMFLDGHMETLAATNVHANRTNLFSAPVD